jgi:glycosyltransferase involved in cell wall biosynthesis
LYQDVVLQDYQMLDNKPVVSVIAPTYNHEKYVAEAIQSVLNQTFSNWELIISDDGSSDQTSDMISSFKDERIKLFRLSENKGALAASENSFLNCKGDYIALLATDDVYAPDKLEKQVSFLQDNPDYAAVFTHAHLIDEDGQDYPKHQAHFRQPNRSRYEWLRHFFSVGNNLCASSAMVRRSCYTKLGYEEKRLSQTEDLNIWIKLCLSDNIHVLQEPLTQHRYRSNAMNASARRADTRIRKEWEYGLLLENYLKISTANELRLVFPEVATYGPLLYDELIPYYVARLALQQEKQGYQAFGLKILYELMADSERAALLTRLTGFSYKDLRILSGQYDVFNVEKKRKYDLLTHSRSWRYLARFINTLGFLCPQDRMVRAIREESIR